jgi:hypothetical protein
MQRILAIATLTWKAAFRFRLFWAILLLLLCAVVALPLLLKDDGTARGFIQILLTYTLGATTALLGISTLWLACGTMARDIEECQMQVVAVKPVARWQIWLGKWLGILLLDATLLAVAGACVYGLLLWRAQRLPAAQQQILRNEIFVARGSLREPPPDIDAAVEQTLRDRVKDTQLTPEEIELVRRQIREQFQAGAQIVPPGYVRPWVLDVGLDKAAINSQPVFLRFKFHAARTNASGTYLGTWQVGMPQQTPVWREVNKYAPDAFHEIQVPAGLVNSDGKLTVAFMNQDESAVLFPIEDGFEVLYRQGGFGLNYARGLLVIFFWLAVLGALGLAAASLLSFPVAAFCTASLLMIALSSGVLSNVVSEGTVVGVNHETGESGGSRFALLIDTILLPIFRAMLAVVTLVDAFSPVDALSTGRSIPWAQVGRAFGQIVLLLGGLLALFGIVTFTRRELATASTNA